MTTDFDRTTRDETPDAIIIVSLQGVVQHWSPGAQALFGYTGSEAVGQAMHDLIVPSERADEESRIRQTIAASGLSKHESLRRKKDGALIYVDVTGKAVRSAQGVCDAIVFCDKDITLLKAERDARLLDARFGKLLESMPDGLVIVNATGRIVLVNSRAACLFGYAPAELCGVPVDNLLPPRDHVIAAGPGLSGVRKDGTEFPVEISRSPLDTGEGLLVATAIRDMSERKRSERTLQEKNAALENANLAKDRFLTGMSHELRTPLNAIIGFTGTLLMRLPGPLTGDQDRQLKTIQASARHLLSLINDLLDLAKIESGKLDMLIEPVICQHIIGQLADTLGPMATQKGLSLRSDLPAAEITVHTDLRALRQILINLINNAIKFTETGGIVIRLSARETGGSRWLDFCVSDSGIGIRPAEQVKLFRAFSQIDAGSTRHVDGTGLGLYLSRKLTGLIGGELDCDSEFGAGSRFTLSLRAA
ncbi:PAS domain S-box protein [Actimicrobium sp. CCC2.4]|uniref:PAS domain-containing sensor histidine kinase n=1 Tax=Actimicrobium sp. CCC2.4 TaxID=3048606 RepID=UPI002AC8DB11|nr:PAS domain S-box protein [Actimicrobium sp. CCC2.4]MEB0136480.1 PAS domain S-box protein [Actimicrobium sp. CCC2.4]WPX30840.1 PAS domain S-box protein [Actimicrobium sp. CCC2.4]